MKDSNKIESIDLSRFEGVDSFLKEIFKRVQPQADCLSEDQKIETFIKVIMDAGKPQQTK
jgi:hypothetical protein